jgi:hypothetical protein
MSRDMKPLSSALASTLFLLAAAGPAARAEAPAPPPPSDAEIEQLIRRLDHSDFDERERASRAIEALGDRAIPALPRARDSDAPEIRARAVQLTAQYQREVDQKDLEARQRPARLHLVTLDAADTPLGDVLDALSNQSVTALRRAVADVRSMPKDKPGALDLSRRVSLRVKDTPLIKALH